MADTFNVGTERLFLVADNTHQINVQNRGPGTVYYGDKTVSSTVNDGSITSGDDTDLSKAKFFTAPSLAQLVVTPSVTQDPIEIVSHDYTGTSSHQVVAADFNLATTAGKDVASGSAYLGAMMGNVLGAVLTKTGNYLAGVIAAYNVTGTKASTYPTGAVVAEIGDGVTEVDGAVVAALGGDSATTTGEAAFKVMSNNSTAASGFDFALDAQDAAHDGYQPVDSAFYNKGILRLTEDICLLVGTAAPTNGVTGANVAGPGSLHLNSSDGKVRTNTNTKASPTWTVVGTQA